MKVFNAGIVLVGIAFTQIVGCGSDDKKGSGGSALECSGAVQVLPATCQTDAATGAVTCGNMTNVPGNVDACDQCGDAAGDLGLADDPLTPCACQKCAIQLAGCFQSASRETGGDAARDAACGTVVKCALRTGCQGIGCYCGAGVTVADCLASAGMGPKGPCAAEIAAASSCMVTDGNCVAAAQLDANSALGRAYAVALCTTGDPVGVAAPVAGNCAAPM